MGAEESKLVEGSSIGFHVLRVEPNSPGELAGLEPFFDWILYCNKHRLDVEDSHKYLVKNTQLDLVVYSSKRRGLRKTTITPCLSFGLKLRLCDYDGASDHLWQVLKVHPNSPASHAGLQSDSDFIIGSPSSELKEKDDLFKLIESNRNMPLKLWIYNSVADLVREVLVLPNPKWGGTGSMGCNIGYGLLHRIPKPEPLNKEADLSRIDTDLDMMSLDLAYDEKYEEPILEHRNIPAATVNVEPLEMAEIPSLASFPSPNVQEIIESKIIDHQVTKAVNISIDTSVIISSNLVGAQSDSPIVAPRSARQPKSIALDSRKHPPYLPSNAFTSENQNTLKQAGV